MHFTKFKTSTAFALLSIMFIVFLIMMMMTTISANAQLPNDADDISLAVNFDKIVDDTGWGALVSAPIHAGKIDGYVAAILQGGDIYRGKYHAEIGTQVANFGLRSITFGTLKGYELDELGNEKNIGFAIDTPDIKGTSVRIGIFGRNAGEFGRPNARDTLEDNGYDPNTLDGLGLESISPPPAGLSFKAGNSLNALVSADFNLKGVSTSIKAMPELTGEGEPAHQGIISFHASRNVTKNIGIDIGIEYGIQYWNNTTETETAYFTALSFNF